jgi:hypothetical protein
MSGRVAQPPCWLSLTLCAAAGRRRNKYPAAACAPQEDHASIASTGSRQPPDGALLSSSIMYMADSAAASQAGLTECACSCATMRQGVQQNCRHAHCRTCDVYCRVRWGSACCDRIERLCCTFCGSLQLHGCFSGNSSSK